MSETPTQPSSPTRPAKGSLLGIVVPLTIIAALVGTASYFALSTLWSVQEADVAWLIRHSVVNPTKLDPAFTDADDDLVADPPKDSTKLLDPDELVFSTLDRDAEKQQNDWKEFVAFLEKTTGKKVKLVQKQFTSDDEIAEAVGGQVHILAANTGLVPTVVNKAGFVPVCVMADADGSFGYKMKFIVPADSPIQNLADLKDKPIALGSLRSHSSFKAPVYLLSKELRLFPNFIYAGTQDQSILGIAKGEFQVAPVAGDYLERILASGKAAGQEFDPKKVRVLTYESPTYPPACFGCVCTLKPELADKVRKAFLEFDWKDTNLKKAYEPAHQVKFVPVEYKKHWQDVREVDEAINKIIEEAKSSKKGS